MVMMSGRQIRRVGNLLVESSESRALLEPLTRSYTKIRDAREIAGKHPAPSREVELFLRRRQQMLSDRPRISADLIPQPGGLGAGISYADSLLHFQNSTAVYFYLVAPPTIGLQTRADLLYMTSSNAASKGCEALLSFFTSGQDRCFFRIWDWAHPDLPGGGKFVKCYPYEEIQEYLIPYSFSLKSGQELDTVCIYIANVTRQTNRGSFQNEVYLQNHLTGTRDLVWSYSFDWPDKDTVAEFWWGPIFETFPNPGAQYSLTNPVGFDQTVIVQDGVQYTLTDGNSSVTTPSDDGLSVIYRSGNHGMVCGLV
jgi:hypothetical protein